MGWQRRSLLACALWMGGTALDWPGPPTHVSWDPEQDSAAERVEILRGLSVGPPARATEALRQGLLDTEPTVRVAAAEAAGSLRLRELEPTLVGGLGAPEASVREAYVRTLGQLGSIAIAPALMRSLADAEPTVRAAAADALADLHAEQALPALLSRLDDADTHARLSVVRAVGVLGTRTATLPLLTHVRDPVPEVRAAVVRAIGAVRDPLAEGALLAALSDSSEEVVLAALSALGTTPSPDALDTLQPWLHQRDTRRASAAYAALAYLDAPQALAVIVGGARQRRLRELTPAVFAHALAIHPEWSHDAELELARALGEARQPEEQGSLLQSLLAADLSPDAPILRVTLLSLLASPSVPSAALLSTLSRSRVPAVCLSLLEQTVAAPRTDGALLDALERCVPDGQGTYTEPLQQWLSHTREPARQTRILGLIARAGASRAGPALLPWLASESPKVRVATLRTLTRLAYAPGLTVALESMDDAHIAVREAAADAVGALCDDPALATLVDEFTGKAQPDLDRRHGLLRALAGALRRPHEALAGARTALFDTLRAIALESSDERDAALALTALAALGGAAAGDTLAQLDGRYAPVRRVAATRALAQLPPAEAEKRLRQAARSPDRYVAATALVALSPFAVWEDRPWLQAYVREAPWPVAPAAAQVLARLALRGHVPTHPTGTEIVCELVAANDPHISANGIAALAALPAATCPSPLARWAEYTPVDVRTRAARLHFGKPVSSLNSGVTAAGPFVTWTSIQYADGSVALMHPDALGSLGRNLHPPLAVESPWSAPFLAQP